MSLGSNKKSTFAIFFLGLACSSASALTQAEPLLLKYVKPSGNITSSRTATFYLQTLRSASCKYSTVKQDFAKMPFAFKSTGGTIHGHGLSGLTPKKSYTYYIACQGVKDKVVSAVETVQFTTAAEQIVGDKVAVPTPDPAPTQTPIPASIPSFDLTGLSELGPEAFLPSPAGQYSAERSCAIYKFYDSSPAYNMYVTENFSKEATASAATCKKFIEKYYLSHEGCGVGGIDNKYWSVVGVLKNTADGVLKFSTTGGLRNISLQQGSSVVAMSAAKCVTSEAYQKSKGTLWSQVNSCDYAKTKFCVNPYVPLLSQSSPQLASYIAKATGDSTIKKDMGWCGAVSLTMSTLGAIYSSPGEILQDPFFWKNNLPSPEKGLAITDLFERTAHYADFVYQIGNIAGTNWAKGGTLTDRGLETILSRQDPSIGNLNKVSYEGEVLTKRFKVLTDEWSNEALVKGLTVGQNNNFARGSGIIRDCYAQTVKKVNSDDKRDYWELSNFQCEWKRSGMTHALSVNGLEDGYVKIYDPWGKVYNLQIIENAQVPTLNMKVALAIPVGGSGYFRDSGMMDESLEGYVQKMVTAKGAPAPVGRRAINYFYIAIYGYQTGIVGKAKDR
ncbi:hypothetical protein [Bdellovibrio sp. HCB-162]|uniref:hypothetical protein n=1 Tax=Bdellovibrio sp. HCB-162 TaxID=3394234 RepID=UPI0039BC7A58